MAAAAAAMRSEGILAAGLRPLASRELGAKPEQSQRLHAMLRCDETADAATCPRAASKQRTNAVIPHFIT